MSFGGRVFFRREEMIYMKKTIVNERVDFGLPNFKIMIQDKAAESTEQAFHEEIEIKYFYEGKSAFSVNSNLILASAGDIAVVNPYELHYNEMVREYDGRYYFLKVGLDFLSDMPDGIDLRQILICDGKKINNHISNDKRLSVIISRVFEEMQAERPYYQLVVRSLMSEFFALLLRDYMNEEATSLSEKLDLKSIKAISPALARIHSDYGENLTVDELSELCFISKYHFCRVFKQVMNMTVVQYLVKYRIDMADAMLASTDKSVNEVGSLCGFNDESYFYRCFKKIKGRSPKKRK